MAEANAPAANDKGQEDDSNTRQDNQTNGNTKESGTTSKTVVKLGTVGSIPMKVPQGQEQSNHKSNKPSSSKQQTPGAGVDDPPRERIYLSKESMARVRDAVEHGKLLPASATRDELRAYNKMASELTQQARQRRLEMEKQERAAAEQKNNRKPPPRGDSPDRGSPLRAKSKFSNLQRTNRVRVIRKLDDDFKLEEEDDEEEPLTPAEALISARDYLSRAQKSRQNRPDRNTSIALQIMKDAIAASAPKKSGARRPTRERTPDRDPSSPEDDDSSDDWRKRDVRDDDSDFSPFVGKPQVEGVM